MRTLNHDDLSNDQDDGEEDITRKCCLLMQYCPQCSIIFKVINVVIISVYCNNLLSIISLSVYTHSF